MRKLIVLLVVLLLWQTPARAAPPWVLVFSGFTATSSPTAIDTSASHIFVKVWSNCTQTTYLAFSPGVTNSNGIPLPAGSWIEFDLETSIGNRLFAVVTSGSCNLRVMEKKT